MATNGTPDDLPVLVIGAGCCGLAIAHGLQRANIPVAVFEQDPPLYSRVEPRDWAIACHWSGPILANLVGEEKWRGIQEAGVDPNMTVEDIRSLPAPKVLHGITGEPLAEMVTGGEPFFRFLHSRLRGFLANDIEIQYNKSLDHFSCEKPNGSHQGIITCHFKDGTEVRGRLLIGADGVKSRVRSQLFASDPSRAALNRLPYAATFVNASFTADQARYIRAAQQHPLGCVLPHPKGRMTIVSVLDATQAESPETWRFNFYVGYQCSIEEQDRKATPRERLQEAKQMVKDDVMADPVKSVFEWVRDDTETVYFTKLANWDPSLPEHKWDNHDGLVTLAGDACHPMTFRLNHAIADASKIVELLTCQGEQTQKERIEAYEVDTRERGGTEVRLSELNTKMLHNWEELMKSPLITRGVQVK